eukprot:6214015-Pleurochrysis_carterae.AAC.3
MPAAWVASGQGCSPEAALGPDATDEALYAYAIDECITCSLISPALPKCVLLQPCCALFAGQLQGLVLDDRERVVAHMKRTLDATKQALDALGAARKPEPVRTRATESVEDLEAQQHSLPAASAAEWRAPSGEQATPSEILLLSYLMVVQLPDHTILDKWIAAVLTEQARAAEV